MNKFSTLDKVLGMIGVVIIFTFIYGIIRNNNISPENNSTKLSESVSLGNSNNKLSEPIEELSETPFILSMGTILWSDTIKTQSSLTLDDNLKVNISNYGPDQWRYYKVTYNGRPFYVHSRNLIREENTNLSIRQEQKIIKDISITEIRSQLDNLSNSIKSDANLDQMYLVNEINGDRWIYLENTSMDGLPSDEEYLSLDLSKIVIKMLYKSVNFNVEESIDLNSFIEIMKSKNIKGFQFKTANNRFFFLWDKFIINQM